mgnify:CR=1 FL=1
MSDPFASASDLAEYINVGLPDDLSRMQALLRAASAVIRGYTGQVLSPVVNEQITVQPMYSLTTGQMLPLPRAYGELIFLPQRPVTAISGITISGVAFTSFSFTSAGILYRTDGNAWTNAAVVTYSHGWAETTDEYQTIKNICIEAAARAYTMNERSASEVLGSTVLESAGYSPEVFLTEGEKMQLQFGRAYIG